MVGEVYGLATFVPLEKDDRFLVMLRAAEASLCCASG